MLHAAILSQQPTQFVEQGVHGSHHRQDCQCQRSAPGSVPAVDHQSGWWDYKWLESCWILTVHILLNWKKQLFSKISPQAVPCTVQESFKISCHFWAFSVGNLENFGVERLEANCTVQASLRPRWRSGPGMYRDLCGPTCPEESNRIQKFVSSAHVHYSIFHIDTLIDSLES